jgi:biopolymer transport protein ExbD
MLFNLLNLPERRANNLWDCVPFINVFLIVILFYALGNRLFMAPGMPIELPTTSSPQHLQGTLYDSVLTIINTDTILFEDNTYHANSIASALQKYPQGKRSNANPILLIKCDQSCSIQQILTLCSQARDAGYTKIHLASNLAQIHEKP